MIVVADSSPLRYLILIEEWRLLPLLFADILTSPGVITELSQPDTPLPVRVWIERLPAWIAVRSPRTPLPAFPFQLGVGECEAIALVEELSADALLADDGAARREASRRQIPVQGTLGILDLAAQNGFVEMPVALDKLLSTNFRASRKLIQFFLDRDARRTSSS
jgi:predicted nucleic acid-binding protein